MKKQYAINRKKCAGCERALSVKKFVFVDETGASHQSEFCHTCRGSTKHCGGCDRVLPRSEFPTDNSRPDRLHYRCRECKNFGQRRRQRRKSNCVECKAPLLIGRKGRCDECKKKSAFERAIARLRDVPADPLRLMKRPNTEAVR